MYKVLVLLCVTSVAYGQITVNGTCDFELWQDNLNVNLLTGDWYQYKRINETSNVDGNCLHLNFSFNQTTREARVTTTSVANKKKVSRNAIILMKSANTLQITYTDGISYEMVIQKSDYVNYLILHGCTNDDTTKSVYGQVYTRKTEVSEATKNAIEAALKANTDFTNATWYEVSHSSESCQTDNGMNLQVSSLLLLLAGLVLAKNM